MDDEYDSYNFDDAVGNTSGNETGYSGDQSNYNSDFSDWNYSNGNYDYTGGNDGNMAWYDPNQQNTFGAGGYQVGQDNTQFWNNQQGQPIGFQEVGGEFTPYQNMQQQGMDWANLGKSGMDALGKLFSGGSGGATSAFLKGLAGMYAANQEKKSNKYMANQGPQNLNAYRQFATPYDVSSAGAGMMTPGATTMRDAAMQQAAMSNQRLQNFRADPNSDAGYKDTTSQIENVLARQAAQHGNRGNFNATAPALLAAKAAAQMQYDKNYQADLNSWDTRSGANINPNVNGGLEALMNSSMYGAQGNAPYMDAIGKILNTNSYSNNPQIAELIAAINGSKG